MKETLEAKVINGNITLTLPEKTVDPEIIKIQERNKEIVKRMENSPGSLDSYVKQYSNDDKDVNEIVGGFYTWIKNTKFGKLMKYLHTESPFPVRALTYGTEIFVGGAVLGGCSGTVIPEPPPPGPVQKIEIPPNYDHEFTKEIMGYGVENKINRWNKNPAVWIGANASQDYIDEAKEAVGKLAKFTNNEIVPYVTDNEESADITFKWVDNLEDLPIGGVANVFLKQVYNGVIKKAEIYCWNKMLYGTLGGNCLEELTQALGPMFDTETYSESIFSASTKKFYCEQDLAAGKVIYQLEPGTTFTEFDEIVAESLKTYFILN